DQYRAVARLAWVVEDHAKGAAIDRRGEAPLGEGERDPSGRSRLDDRFDDRRHVPEGVARETSVRAVLAPGYAGSIDRHLAVGNYVASNAGRRTGEERR